MTACAMSVGMLPMALALERGSQMQAPLGRAVIGGLLMSTFATLLVLPSIFALVVGRRVAKSPSIYPDDPASAHYDPMVFVDAEGPTEHEEAPPGKRALVGALTGEPATALDDQNGEVLSFLGKILNEARSRRHDLVTNYTVEDLLVALGFSKTTSDGSGEKPVGRRSWTRAPQAGSDSAADRGRAPPSENDTPHSQGDS
jgi:hypothetical protein